jgi:hypothetical protein
MTRPAIDLELLLKLRLVVARFGEMDVAKWWNTKGQLGPLGTAALRRGFPRTHRFAQARSVFAVAAHRCSEVFDPPGCATLWRLPEVIEESFENRWEYWLDHAADWAAFFASLERIESEDLVGALAARDLVADGDVAAFTRLKRSAEGRAVPLAGTFTGADRDVKLLALGFGRSEAGRLAIPYMRRDDS